MSCIYYSGVLRMNYWCHHAYVIESEYVIPDKNSVFYVMNRVILNDQDK